MIADATGRQAKTIREFLAEGALAALDVGCGLGAKTSFIARHVKGTVGIDPNAGDVREAQNRYGGRHLSFLVAGAEMLCFADGSFDVIFFNESLHHVPVDRQADALREGHRVLQPRGRMLIIEPIHGSGVLGQILKLYLDEAVSKQHALKAIEAVRKDGFALRARTEIQIQCRFYGFDDFFADYRLSRPEAAADGVTKRDIRARFDRCPRHTAGDTLIDYTASVWHLVKK
jgi:SAM-dependent methyltransferase